MQLFKLSMYERMGERILKITTFVSDEIAKRLGDELSKRFGVIKIKVDNEKFARFYFKKNTNYIDISKLQKVLDEHNMKIYGVDPNDKYMDIEFV
jgi:hypothetical protein